MQGFLYKLPRNIAEIFRGWNLLWHLAAISLTYILVISGFDWFYFRSTRSSALEAFLFPAAIVGGFVPLTLPFITLAVGKYRKSFKISNTAYALGQAALFGFVISDFYKSLTGRVPPPEIFGNGLIVDVSQKFQFGFLRGGVFWGWPSSHSTIAFAMAAALLTLYPKNKLVRCAAVLYALYVGIGVSATIHWFSDFAAGAIIGSVIGVVVGKIFRLDGPLAGGDNDLLQKHVGN